MVKTTLNFMVKTIFVRQQLKEYILMLKNELIS